jgi:ankyrin repeat protein
MLIENSADVNILGRDSYDALCAASSRGHLEIVQMLVENGTDVNTQGGERSKAVQTV